MDVYSEGERGIQSQQVELTDVTHNRNVERIENKFIASSPTQIDDNIQQLLGSNEKDYSNLL